MKGLNQYTPCTIKKPKNMPAAGTPILKNCTRQMAATAHLTKCARRKRFRCKRLCAGPTGRDMPNTHKILANQIENPPQNAAGAPPGMGKSAASTTETKSSNVCTQINRFELCLIRFGYAANTKSSPDAKVAGLYAEATQLTRSLLNMSQNTV